MILALFGCLGDRVHRRGCQRLVRCIIVGNTGCLRGELGRVTMLLPVLAYLLSRADGGQARPHEARAVHVLRQVLIDRVLVQRHALLGLLDTIALNLPHGLQFQRGLAVKLLVS